jgi:hypothetical protein
MRGNQRKLLQETHLLICFTATFMEHLKPETWQERKLLKDYGCVQT